MHPSLHVDEVTDWSAVSTGNLPPAHLVQARLNDAHARYSDVSDGAVATYIPALARVPHHLFGLCIAGVDGSMCCAGDSDHEFSIQSIAKPFVFALVCQALGGADARSRIGVNSSGLSFSSVMAVELHANRTINPMVNGGAIATTSLAPGESTEEKWHFVADGLSRFAGRRLVIDMDVYRSEAATNQRNQSIALLLASYGRMFADPLEAAEIYTRQCSLKVTVADLARMGATLADGGVNPSTGERVIDAACCARVLAVLSTAGMYEQSGDWLYEVGLPGKSGVSGGIVTVAPGKGGLATFAPPLDETGNSVRGQLATRFLAQQLGLNLFASRAARSSSSRGTDGELR
jgi:glutaminase